MNAKQFLVTVALVGIVLTSPSALAAVIVTTNAGSANFGSGGVGYASGTVAPNPNSNTSLAAVGIGGDSFTTTNRSYDFSSSGQYNVWCVDIYHWMINGAVTYIVGTGADLATQLSTLRPGTPDGTLRVSQLIQLANQVYNVVDTKTESAAFQLAVWAIAFGTADSAGKYHINTTDAGFHVGSSTTVNADFGVLANQWLSNLGAGLVTGNYSLTYLNDGTLNNTQDVIVFTPKRSLNVIPEPATIALFSLGLLGLGWFGRRQKIS